MNELLEKLKLPFDPTIVKWRVGATNSDKSKGMALAYVDARIVMDRLDELCFWQDKYPWSDGNRVCCSIGINFDEEWFWRTDGAGETDVEGDKGSMSDAFKRAAVKWGVGRYLYALPSPWIEIVLVGRSYKIADEAALTERLVKYQEKAFG